MWMSRHLNQTRRFPLPEEARVTLEGAAREVTGSLQTRNFMQYTPYGYQCALPEGSQVLMVPAPSGSAAVGVASEDAGLRVGEIRIVSPSGAFLFLRQDGSAVINGLVISPEGKIVNQ